MTNASSSRRNKKLNPETCSPVVRINNPLPDFLLPQQNTATRGSMMDNGSYEFLGGIMDFCFWATPPRASTTSILDGGFPGLLLAAIVLVAVVAAAVAVWVNSRKREDSAPRYVQLYPVGAYLWGQGPRVVLDGGALKSGLRCESAAVVAHQGRLYLRIVDFDPKMLEPAAAAVGVVVVPVEVPDAWAATAPWRSLEGPVEVPEPGGWVLGLTSVGEAMALHPVAGSVVVVAGPSALLGIVRRGLEASWPAELFEVVGESEDPRCGMSTGQTAEVTGEVTMVRVVFVEAEGAAGCGETTDTGLSAATTDTDLKQLAEGAGVRPTLTVAINALPGQSFVHHHGHKGHREFFTLWTPPASQRSHPQPETQTPAKPVPPLQAVSSRSLPPLRAQSGSVVPGMRARHRRDSQPSPGSAPPQGRQEPPDSGGRAGVGQG